MDLRHLAIETYRKLNQTPSVKLGLKSLARRHLNVVIKDYKPIRMGNWEAPTLSGEQVSKLPSIHLRIFLKMLSNSKLEIILT